MLIPMKRLLVVILFTLFTSLTSANESPESTGLDQEKFKKIAEKLFIAQKLIPEEYEYAGNITLGMYYLRYLGELSPFVLKAKDLDELIIAVEKLYGEELNQTLKDLLQGIARLKFTKENNKYTTKIFTKNQKTISVPIDVKREGLVSSINDFRIEHKAEITLHNINNNYYKKKYYRMLLKKKEVFQLPKVHLVEEQYLEALQYYLTLKHDIYPIAGTVSGMGFNISLSRWFPKTIRTVDVKVGEIGSFLGIKDLKGNNLSPFWLSAKKLGVHVISTLDN